MKDNAILMGHARRVSMKELASMPAPDRTDTWNPVAHVDVVNAIRKQVTDRGWQFSNAANPFEVSVTKTKMFGVASIVAPIMDGKDYRLAVGFCQSYDKTMALKIAVGEHVMVCDNMCMFGNVVFRREHTSKFDVNAEATRAFEHVEESVVEMIEFNGATRKRVITRSMAIEVLVEASMADALPQTRLLDAVRHYDAVLAGKAEDIDDPLTLWGAKQAVTHELRGMSPAALYRRSDILNAVVRKYAQ